MDTDFGLSGSVPVIASSTSSFLVEFFPFFALVGGILLAVLLIERIIFSFFPERFERDRIE